jgi:Uma2 family endonuclease
MPKTLYPAPQPFPTAADLTRKFGAIPMNRLRLDRYPADETDVVELHETEKRLYELVDGYLLEKDVASQESVIALALGSYLRQFVKPLKLGFVMGEQGMLKLRPGLVRIPDVSFVHRDQFPDKKMPDMAILDRYPDLAIEVLSPSNTDEEMEEKIEDYFSNGTRLVWIVDLPTKSVQVLESADRLKAKTLSIKDTLDGGPVLPGFQLPIATLFDEFDLN